MTDPTYLPPLNRDAALKTGEEIDSLLGQISAHELRLSHSYARLGGLLREVKVNQYWISYGFPKFSAYLDSVREKIDRRRSQVYAILSVAEILLPLISEETLELIGITKAHELRRLVREGGSVSSQITVMHSEGDDKVISLVSYASDPRVTAAALRVKVNELLHVHEGPKGNWIDLGGFYATTEERKEIEDFWNIGQQLFSPPDEQSEHVIKHDVFLAGVRESLGTWKAEVVDGR